MKVQRSKIFSLCQLFAVIAVAASVGSCSILTGGLRVGGSLAGTVSAGGSSRHELKITEASAIVIDVISEKENFDPMVELMNQAGNSLGSNDDGGQNLNARLKVQVTPGAYAIIVKGYGGSSGPYRVVVSREGEGPGIESQSAVKDKGSIRTGDTKTGTISPYESHFYSFKSGKKNMVVIDGKKSQGSGFDPYLLLMTQEGSMVKQDDDGGGDLNARAAACFLREPGRQLPRFVDAGSEAGEIQPQEFVTDTRVAEPRAGAPDKYPGVIETLTDVADVGVAEADTRAEKRAVRFEQVAAQRGGLQGPLEFPPAGAAPEPPDKQGQQQRRDDGEARLQDVPGCHSRPVNSSTTRISTTTPRPPLGK